MKNFILLALCLFTYVAGYAQNIITQQNFDSGAADCWSYTGGNLDATHRYNGTNSARVGRNGESNTMTFDPVTVTGYAGVQLSFRHGVRSGSGPGMDTREGAVFQVRLNGGVWTTIGAVAGNTDYNWTFTTTPGGAPTPSNPNCNVYQAPNPLVYNVPAGTNTVEFRVVTVKETSTAAAAVSCPLFNDKMANATAGNYERTDEGIHIDEVQLTTTSPIPGAITGGGTFCGGTHDFTRPAPLPGFTYYWQTTATGTSTLNSALTYSVSSTTTIYLRARNNCSGAWSTAESATITINPPPAATTAAGGGTFCGSTTITASGGAGGTIYFQGTTSGGTSTATPSTSVVVTSSGTYYFRSRSAAGCWGPEGSVSVTINPIPAATTASGGGTFCGSTAITASGGAGGTIYFQGTTSGGTNTATPSTSEVVTSSGTYYFRSRSAAGCWGPEGSVTVTINTPPAATAGSPAVVCGTGHTLAGSALLTGQSGLWTVQSKPSGAANPVFANPTLPNTGVTFTDRGTYTLRWTVSATACPTSHADVNVTYLTGSGSTRTWTGLAASVGGDGEDWTDCRNWAEGAVPTAGQQVLLGNILGAEFGGGSITTLPQNIPTLSLDRLHLNNGLAGGASLASGAVLTLTNHLILENGWLNTSGTGYVSVTNPSATLGIVRNAALDSHDHTNSNAYVRGTLRRSVNSTDTYRFPVGDASYRMAEVTPATTPPGGSYVETAFQSSVIPSGLVAFLPYNNHNGVFTKFMTDGSWRVESNIASPQYSIELYPGSAASLNFCDGSPCAAYTLAKKSGGIWTNGSSQPLFYGPNGLGQFEGRSTRNSVGRSGYTSFSEFVILGSPDELLPLAQLQLQGQWQGNRTRLQWVSTQEEGVLAFELERSAPGQGFSSVTQLSAQGYTQGKTHYEALDTQPLPEAFYRVRAVDADGSFTYSNVVYLAAAPDLAAASSLSVYPNPSAGAALHITYPAGSTQLRLHNALGQVVRSQALAGDAGNVLWEVSALSAGVYTLLATAPSGTYTQKVIINSAR